MSTSDGGLTWRDTAPASSSPDHLVPMTVSCATALDCFVTVSRLSKNVPYRMGPNGYEDAMIEATHDGGATWTRIAMPTVDGAPLAEVFPLSCPSPAGCIAEATTPRQDVLAGQREIISSLPETGHPRSG